MFANRQACQDVAFLLAFAGILCVAVAVVLLTFRVNALEKAQEQQQPRQQSPQSNQQPESIYQHNERGRVGQLKLSISPFLPSFRCEDFALSHLLLMQIR